MCVIMSLESVRVPLAAFSLAPQLTTMSLDVTINFICKNYCCIVTHQTIIIVRVGKKSSSLNYSKTINMFIS